MAFPLPHCPSLTSIDPLGICDEIDSENAQQGQILERLLNTARTDLLTILESAGELNATSRDAEIATRQAFSHRFTTLIQDIAYSLHGDGDLKTTTLHHCLVDTALLSLEDFGVFTAHVFDAAVSLPVLFPTHELSYLIPANVRCTLTLAQTDALLAHLFLGTLQKAPGTDWGRPGFAEQLFGASRETHPQAAEYVRVLIRHFVASPSFASNPGSTITFTLSTSGPIASSLATSTFPAPRIPVTLVPEPLEPSSAPSPGTFVLVAAHSQPGPGPSCTHEERLVGGQSPALAIVSLLVPVIPADAAVIISPLPVHAEWRGHGRSARLLRMLEGTERVKRGYIVADALEMEDVDGNGLPDLKEGVVEREVGKLIAAFRGVKDAWEETVSDCRYALRIEMPPWGCGAFGGNLKVKMRCMQMAAGLVGLKEENLVLFVPEGMKDQVLQQEDASVRTVGDISAELKGRGNKK